MKLNVEQPTTLIDINRLPINEIVVKDGVRIDANVRNSDLAHHDAIKTMFPALSEALLSGASAQLRNMATTAGNLMQRTRCYYFRDVASVCNKARARQRLRRDRRLQPQLCGAWHERSVHRHASIGHVRGAGRLRRDDHYQSAEDSDQRVLCRLRRRSAKETVLNHGEMITAVELPNTPFFARSHYLKTRDRASYEFALASAAVALDIDGGTIKQARVALGGVASKPWRSAEAEKVLVGGKASDQLYAQAAEAALKDAKPQKFKTHSKSSSPNARSPVPCR